MANRRIVQKDPPNVLLMRRVSIRQYPDGKKVALYKIDKLDQYITVPFNESSWSLGKIKIGNGR